MKKLLYIDLFCGAGGTSTGVNAARLNGEQCVCLTTDSGITLAEFKEKYVDYDGKTDGIDGKTTDNSVIPEKPQPKFKVGDKVRVIDYDHSMSSLYYYKNKICRIIGITRQGLYKLELVNNGDKSICVNEALDRADEFIKGIQWCEFYIEPYTEPETKKQPKIWKQKT